MDESERKDLVDALLDELARRGVPEGAWLADIARARRDLAQVDDLLRRLENALMRERDEPFPAVMLLLEALRQLG